MILLDLVTTLLFTLFYIIIISMWLISRHESCKKMCNQGYDGLYDFAWSSVFALVNIVLLIYIIVRLAMFSGASA